MNNVSVKRMGIKNPSWELYLNGEYLYTFDTELVDEQMNENSTLVDLAGLVEVNVDSMLYDFDDNEKINIYISEIKEELFMIWALYFAYKYNSYFNRE